MERHERQDRAHARAVTAGIAVSVAVHATAFALIRFSVPAFDHAREAREAETSEAVPVLFEPVMQVVALREAPAVEAVAPSPAVAAVASSAAEAHIAVQAEAAPDPMADAADAAVAVADVTDVPAAALPSAESDAAPGGGDLPGEPEEPATVAEALEASPVQDGEEEEEYALPPGVALHVPGSVGRAKGQWGASAGNGQGDDEERRGRVVIIRGGKCPPLPGRAQPPIMRSRQTHHLAHSVGW